MALQGTAVVATRVPLQRAAPAVREAVMDCMRRMRTLGVPFAAGTDAGVTLTPFDSLTRELEILVSEVGFSPIEAIHCATGAAARLLGQAGTVGTLERGRVADIVAVDGDPATRIEDIRNVHRVFKSGRTVAENGIVL